MNNSLVSVVVPSYNRAHLLPNTLVSYLNNKCVKELILVDDASTDKTKDEVAKLQIAYPQIKYIRLDINSKQTFAKNVGIDNAAYEYIYFGDDDSFMQDGAIDQLLVTLIEYNADIVGARALYFKNDDELNNIDKFVLKKNRIRGEVCNLNKLALNFHINPGKIIDVKVCHACFLIKTALAKQIKFDTRYLGSAFREETDFTLRASASGAKSLFNPFITQFNLPRRQASGGAHSSSILKYHSINFINNWKFLKKNATILRKLGVRRSIYFLQFKFFFVVLFDFMAGIAPIRLKFFIKRIIGR